ncbi:MAG: hypothetical protein VZR53_15240 [Prevotella sp.]|jgi:hypothetical protein|nr:hypothetical protein [Prevotella sp.]
MNTPNFKLEAPTYFPNVRQAGAFLSKAAGIEIFCATDCIYKAMKNKSHSTHGYVVERGADKRIALSKIIKNIEVQ